MNREIKFRAFAESEKIMMDTKTIQELVCLGAISVNSAHRLKFMQFTGLQDKNKIDVYEGDICKTENLVFAVKWYNEASAFGAYGGIENGKEVSAPFSWFSDCADFEIIGNIYENKELLESTE